MKGCFADRLAETRALTKVLVARTALAAADVAELVTPLAAIRPHLGTAHTSLANRLDALTEHTDRLRDDTDSNRA